MGPDCGGWCRYSVADPRTRRWGSDGSIVLADSHYSTIGTVTTTTEWKGDRVVNLEGSLFWWGTTVWSASRPGGG